MWKWGRLKERREVMLRLRGRHVALLVAAAALMVAMSPGMRVRRPVGPGAWYPADAAQLYAAVMQYTNEAGTASRGGRLVALLAPNAPYPLSGPTAGRAYSLVHPGQYDRVLAMSPAHYARFRGCSIASVQCYRTPFGDVPLEPELVRRLTWSTLFSLRSVIYRPEVYRRGERVMIHEREHGIEVQLPFLQARLGTEFTIVPVLVGDLVDRDGGFDQHAFDTIVGALSDVVDDDTLIVASANLTHVGPEYGFTPFRGDLVKGVEALDAEALSYIIDRDIAGFRAYMDRTRNVIPAAQTIELLMALLPEEVIGVPLHYETSARLLDDPDSTVSYAAVAFFDPTRPPAEEKPVRLITSRPGEAPAGEDDGAEGEDAAAPSAGEDDDGP